MNRTKIVIAAVTAGSLAAAGVAAAITVGPANADEGRKTVATPAAAKESPPVAKPVARGTTAVEFDAAALTALAPLNPRALKPGSIAIAGLGATAVASFPIVGTTDKGAITHAGGLSLTDGDSTVELRNFVIDTTAATPVLTAFAKVDGAALGRIPFLDVTTGTPVASCDVSAELTLNPVAGFALADVFGVADLSGATIGQGCVDLR